MKLIRWVEVRLSNRKHRIHVKNKDKCSESAKCESITDGNVQNKAITNESMVCQTDCSPSFSLLSEEVCDLKCLPNAVFPNKASHESASFASSLPKLQRETTSSSSPSHTPKSRERSRIKTNPWLHSPWLKRQVYGSSSSTDSGYECDAKNNKTVNETVITNSRNYCQLEHENESSSEDFANSSSSSSVFSDFSINSNDSSEGSECNNNLWPSHATQNANSNFANASNNWFASRHANPLSGLRINENNSFTKSGIYCENRNPKRIDLAKCGKESKSLWLNKKKRSNFFDAKLCRGNERWISLATELTSSDDEYDDRYVPSPAPHDSKTFEYRMSGSSLQSLTSKQVSDHWKIDVNVGRNDDAYASDIESDIIKLVSKSYRNDTSSSLNSNAFEEFDLWHKTGRSSSPDNKYPQSISSSSPQTDSAIGLSEDINSSSSTPSIEMKSLYKSNMTEDRNEINNELRLNEKVSQLRIELTDIVDVAMFDARHEELARLEGRIALQREMIQYKRKLLIQTLTRIRHRLEGNANIY